MQGTTARLRNFETPRPSNSATQQLSNPTLYNPPLMTDRTRGTLFIVAAALLWSTGGIGIKAVADSGLKVTFYRSLFAAIALMLFLGRNVWGRRQWKSTPAFIIAIISYAACL